MTIHAGRIVSRKGGTGEQTLVTYITGDNAQCQWWTADQELHSEMIPVADLELFVPERQRARYFDDQAAAYEEIDMAAWKAQQAALEAAEAANAAVIAAAIAAEEAQAAEKAA